MQKQTVTRLELEAKQEQVWEPIDVNNRPIKIE